MRIEDEAVVLSCRPCGERGAVVSVLSAAHGKVTGYAADGKSGGPQPGYLVDFVWHARTEDRLGSLYRTTRTPFSAGLAGFPAALYALRALLALFRHALPERDPCPPLFAALREIAERLADSPVWSGAHFAKHLAAEAALLRTAGYGVAVERCAADGCAGIPAYASPKTGHGVCADCGAPYRDRLLPLTEGARALFLHEGEGAPLSGEDAACAAGVCGYFLDKRLFDGRMEKTLPERESFLRQARRVSSPDKTEV
jgi:DNA repair protein RecO (recombination protein O)